MRGPFTELAEIACAADDARAEMVMPDAVRHHARGEWIIRTGDRFGKLQSAAAYLKRRRLSFRQNGQKAPRRLFAGILRIAADGYTQIRRLGGIANGVEKRIFGRQAVLERLNFSQQAIHVRAPVAIEKPDDLEFQARILVHFAVI